MPSKGFKFNLPDRLKRDLLATSKRKGVSLADVIREALWEYIRREAKP